MTNIMKMVKQAQQMQAKMAKMEEELAKEEFEVAAVDGTGKGRIVNEFKGPAHWKPSSKSRDSTTGVRYGAGDVQSGGVALDGRVRGDNEFADMAVANTRGQIPEVQIFRADSVDRRQHSVEDVVKTPVVTGAFHDNDVLRLLDHANQLLVAAGIFANCTLLGLGDGAAGGAEMDLLFELGKKRRKTLGVLVGTQEVQRKAQRTLGPDAGQTRE